MTADLTIRPLAAAAAGAESEVASRAGRVRETADAAQKFEAFVLQTFIQDMMPKEAEGVFGSGVSGDFWRSLMAEKVAEQVAERGTIGIADIVRGEDNVPVRPTSIPSLDVLTQLSKLDAEAFASADDDLK